MLHMYSSGKEAMAKYRANSKSGIVIGGLFESKQSKNRINKSSKVD